MDEGAPTPGPTMLSSALPPPHPRPEAGQFADAAPPLEQPKRAGQLTPGWRLVFGIGWAAIVVCYAAVWETSRVMGLSTWWLGAEAEPQMLLVKLLPFYGPILAAAAAAANWRYCPYLGIAVSVIGGAIAAGDLGRVRWLAVVELVLAGAGLCISVASLAGMYRPVRRAGAVS